MPLIPRPKGSIPYASNTTIIIIALLIAVLIAVAVTMYATQGAEGARRIMTIISG